MMKKFPWFETILVIIVMSISLYAAFSDAQNLPQRWFMRDDAYYYFKVAQNISEGRGSTFDGINPTNGYHPLWMAVCVPIFALARFDLILPLRILLLVMSGLSVATGILLYRFLAKVFAPFIGALAAIYWVFDTTILNNVYRQGLETGIAAFFIVLFLYKLYDFESTWRRNGFSRQQLATLALLAALTMFSRLDLIFFAGMAGLWIVFRGHALRYYLPLDIVAIIFSVLFAFTTKFGFPEYFEHTNAAMTMVGVALFIRLPAAYFLGLHQNPSAEKPSKTLAKLAVFALVSSAAISVVMLVVARVMDFDAMPRTVLAMDAVFSFLFIGATRFLHRDLHTASSQPKTDTPIRALQTNWKQWLIEGSLYYGIVAGLLGVYMLWSKFAFGTFSPVSGQIKRWWGSFITSFYGKYPQDTLTFFGVNTKGDGAAWQPISEIFGKWSAKLTFLNPDGNTRYVIVIVAAALIFHLILRTDKQKARTAIARLGILPLFTGCFLQVISYNALGYSAEKYWYWIGELIAIVLAASLFTGMVTRLVPASSVKQIVAWSIVAVLGLSSSLSFWDIIKTDMPHGHWQEDAAFVDIIPILEANTEPGSIIGLTGGGNTGYFIHDRTIVNMDGLINSQPYFESLKDRTAGAYLESTGLDYVFANKYILESQPYKGMFDAYLTDTGIELGGNVLMKYGRAQ
jgi:hypothetical protein